MPPRSSQRATQATRGEDMVPAHSVASNPVASRSGGSTSLALYEVNEDPQMRNDLVRRTSMLRGVIVTAEGLQPSSWEIIDHPHKLPMTSMNTIDYRSSAVSPSAASKFLQQGWTEEAIDNCAPWQDDSLRVKVSCDIGLREPALTVHSCGYAHFCQGVVDLNVQQLRSSITEEFKGAINTALAAQSREEVVKNLRAVFNRSGHMFRTRFMVGSNLRCTSFQVISAHDTGYTRDTLLGVNYSQVKTWGDKNFVSQKATVKVQYNSVELEYSVDGGQPSLLADPSSWLQYNERYYQGWVIIKVEKAVPIIELLDPEISQQVINAFAPLVGKWIEPGPVAGKMSYKLPDIAKHPGWFWPFQTVSMPGRNSVKCLVVQDRSGQALVPASRGVRVAEDEEIAVYTVVVDNSKFKILGALVWDKSTPPDLSRLCAISRDFFVRGSAGPIINTGAAELRRVLLPPTSIAWGDPNPVVDTGHFVFSNHTGGSNPEPLLLSKYAVAFEDKSL
ncbi:hypothetical protein HYDPIDRAFT_29369 [Hydnomerulius pinastri MD-312]|uniref:MACPF-like domain-containing protein n=1 Tax=Hydnomerulius pinastri MD-312 TaxID=994086 RepID=A0A0C9WE36_9AGAM|nr:hypothetical protein HYDPIDRAFT_29369 [Hydnomerulius pinastri MD-312]